MTIKQSLVTGQGETFTLNIEYTNKAGQPVDLTGHTVELQVKQAGSGIAVGTYPATVDAIGNVGIKVTDEVTDTWPVGRLAYIVKHATPDGDERWLCYGPLTVINGWDV